MLILPSFNAGAISTSAKSAILINGDTGEVIFEQNANEKLPMASTTKIMTALLLCEMGDFEKEVKVTAEMLRVEGSSMGLLAGDTVTVNDLLYGLLLASGNDAANVIAYVLGGTVNGFVGLMNQKAAKLGLNNTNFVTPSGLDANEHYTTAQDLANLARIAMQNDKFAKAVATKSATLNYGNPPYKRTITNHNKLLSSFDGAVGIKTGFTKKAGRCLVSAAKKDGKYVIAVTLNDSNDWKDHASLLEYGLDAVKLIEIKPLKSDYTLSVINGENDLKVNVDSYTVSALKDENFSCVVNLPKFLYAPIEKGEVIGSVVYKKNDYEIKVSEIIAETEIKLKIQETNTIYNIFEYAKYILFGLWEK